MTVWVYVIGIINDQDGTSALIRWDAVAFELNSEVCAADKYVVDVLKRFGVEAINDVKLFWLGASQWVEPGELFLKFDYHRHLVAVDQSLLPVLEKSGFSNPVASMNNAAQQWIDSSTAPKHPF